MAEERIQETKEVQEVLKKTLEEEKIKQMIENNEVEFEVENIKYKVKKPTHQDRQEVFKKKCEKQVELLKERNNDGTFRNLNEKDLIKLYKERGIDIDEISKTINSLQVKEKQLLLKLGKDLKDQRPDNILDSQRKEISDIREKMINLSIERTDLLDMSIESQLLMFIYAYYTYLVTERFENDNWIKNWNSFDDYNKENNNELVNLASSYTTYLMNRLE